MPNGVKLFYSYAHEDENLRRELDKQLTILMRTGILESWHDRKIMPGDEWKNAIDANLNSADVILLLISPDSVASDYCYYELTYAMEKHQRGESVVIPVILRPVPWEGASFSRLQVLPTDGVPVTKWVMGQDDAFMNISEGIRKVANEIIAKRRALSEQTSKPPVYLAETTPDRQMQSYREGIAAELKAHGYPVIPEPDADTPDESPDYEDAIRGYLKDAKLSVHLIGNRYGRTIVGGNDKSVIELQNSLAEEHRRQGGFESLIWIPPEVVPLGSRQEIFQSYLETDQKAQENAELSRKPFESVKDRIIEKLKKLERKAIETDPINKSVYLMCEQKDRESVGAVKNFIFDNGFDVFVSPSLNGQGPGAAYHDKYLKSCDATLIYYGTTNDEWVDFMLIDLKDAPKLRTSDFLCKALFLADPQINYRTRVAEVLKHDGHSLETSLKPFIECLLGNHPRGGAVQ